MNKKNNAPHPHGKNRATLLIIFTVVFGMVVLSFASVPLYNLFCRVTGFGGTTQVATDAPDQILERQVTINFNADIHPGLPWAFKPDQRSVKVHLGKKTLISYSAENLSSRQTIGTALFNVTPPKAGRYFHKIQCFCFDEQPLAASEKAHMPVLFFVDPSMADDPNLDDVTTITLSYTFFSADTEELDKVIEDFYNEPDLNLQSDKNL